LTSVALLLQRLTRWLRVRTAPLYYAGAAHSVLPAYLRARRRDLPVHVRRFSWSSRLRLSRTAVRDDDNGLAGDNKRWPPYSGCRCAVHHTSVRGALLPCCRCASCCLRLP